MKKLAALLIIFVASCTGNAPKENKQASDSASSQATTAPLSLKDSVVVYKYEGNSALMDTAYIKNASEPIKAILAYYCYQFNTVCSDAKHCKLSAALGFGQDSPEHKNLVEKWLKDEDTKTSIAHGGNAKPDGGDPYSWLSSLRILIKDKEVKIKYTSSWISKDIPGKGVGDDNYRIEGNEIKVISRNHTELDVQ